MLEAGGYNDDDFSHGLTGIRDKAIRAIFEDIFEGLGPVGWIKGLKNCKVEENVLCVIGEEFKATS